MSAILSRSPNRTPVVLQMEAAECAAASLAMILGYWGLHLPLDELRQLCGVSRDGAKASSILRAARTLGLEAKGFKAEMAHLVDFDRPVIAFVNFNHFLVVEGADARHVWVNDPANGRARLAMEEFEQSFTGVVLTFAPGPQFVSGDRRPALADSLRSRFDGLRGPLGFAVLVSLALAVPGIVLPVFSRIFVDYVLVRSLDDWLAALLIGMGLTAAVQFVLALLQARALISVRLAMALATGGRLMDHMMRLPISFFSQRFTGEIADRVDLNERLSGLLTGKLAMALVSMITALFFFVAMLFYHWPIALGVLVLAVLNIVVLALSSRVISERYRKLSLDHGKLMGARVAGIKDMETFKASGAEDMLFARWLGLAVNAFNHKQAIARISAWLDPMPLLVGALAVALVLVGGGGAVIAGELTLGELVALQSLAASFSAPVAALAGFGAELQQIRSYTSRLDDVLAQEPAQLFRTSSRETALALQRGRLTLCDVTFGYAPLDPPLIQDFSLELSPGRRIALVGASGSGKSTVGRIIAGLEAPISGTVRIDGTPLDEWPRDMLSQRLAYVPQSIMLFEASFQDNLSLFDPDLPLQDIARACRDAQIHDVIAGRPGNYDAPIAEGGANLSGGERQRLEIARALATDPAILVLDEATSALDPLTEVRVLEAIRRRGMSCIIIAHRLSAIRDADEILVLDKGRIVERGRHEDLVAASSRYRELLEA
ncbi:NHLP family bacteriocin export ABC transporter peptidase/permease/ATPase subunit [Novosphingobium sp. PC22D]|uniref:NHLP family bacteriocin export ABC transporter peptidase/permease/ATPase subunit n=1 Tax=Novosphingobium sp. PC22D TaxID=1962403 RepID=UPI00114546E3|nr:NHLP family bacteriocin export ABC transporter peptidase/permease/ATPase subunit [Novosphingobium sp. PC22D]